MRSADMTIVLVTLVFFATLFATGDACDKGPTRSREDACLKLVPYPELCQDALKNAPDTAELTAYALIVTRLAPLKYDATMATFEQMMTNGTIVPSDVKAAINLCKVKYGEARDLMVSAADHLSRCDLTRTKQECRDAQAALEPCDSKLWVIRGAFWQLYNIASDSLKIPSMIWNDACLNSCNFSQAWTSLCEDKLKNAPPTAEVTVFALAAARKAKLMYESTMGTLDQMLGAGNAPADLRKALDKCKVKYGEAHGLVASIANQLFFCDFSRARQEYLDAQVAVQLCHDALSSFQRLPLYSMVSADYDMTMVAYELGALIVGK